MKTKTTFKLFLFFILICHFSIAQTMVYNETVSSGIFFQGNGEQVSNPLPDAFNATTNVAKSSNEGSWQQIQFFPTFTPSNGDNFYFSVYDPNNVGTAQVKFEYSSNPGVWVDGGDITYVSDSDKGWKEQVISLSQNVGNEINKIILMPGYSTNNVVYVDNVYFHSESIFSTSSQTTIVYDESTSSGIFFQGNGEQVSNPLSDSINSSENVAKSGTGGSWQQIQFFPTFTPASNDKFFFSVYDPNGVGIGQIKFEYASNPGTWVDGGDISYNTGSDTGWKEHSISLEANAGNQINKIIMMPGYDTSSAVYIDNVYFANATTLSTESVNKINENIFLDKRGKIHFVNSQTDTRLTVFDITGRKVIEESIKGKESSKFLTTKGIYIVRIQTEKGSISKKIAFD